MATATEKLLTAEEYRQLPDTGGLTELVRGKVVSREVPGFRYGVLCARITHCLQGHVDENDVGHVIAKSGVITERNPDTVRGADVAFYSYERLPQGQVPEGYPQVLPEVVFEVRSPSDRWSEVLGKTAEYLRAGVGVVIVVDMEARTVHVFRESQPSAAMGPDGSLALPEVPGGFELPIAALFKE